MYEIPNNVEIESSYDEHDEDEKKWQRALFVKQDYPDNYVDPKRFLEHLVISRSPTQVPMSNIVLGSTLIIQQLSVIAIFVGLYKYIMNKVITFHGLLAFDIITLLLGNLTNYLLSESQWYDIKQGLQYLVIMGVCLRIAAPVLQTLTSSFSDDTIYALGIFFSVTHVVFRDYSNMSDYDGEVKVGTLSLSAAMLTAILLASRLQKIELVFGFVLLAVICFSLFPITARVVYKRSKIYHLSLLMCQWLLATALLYGLQELYAFFIAYEVLVVFVLIVGPVGLSSMYMHKKSMSGPWDIAKL